MSILKKAYEISVWDDIWDGSGFVETRMGTIGSDSSTFLGRALEPKLTTNVNGTKKFSFKMYSRYFDNITGEKVENPYIKWMTNERKIKLFYKNKWYDFVIKNIKEDRTNCSYSYELEDMLVNELSKNGFGVVLDEEKRNNSGTPKVLAERVLEETDWKVSEKSEVIVQIVEESLIYLRTREPVSAYRLLDQNGNYLQGIKKERVDIPADQTVLAFYSSCRNKPVRFQFIYLKNGFGRESVNINADRIILNEDSQYYYEYSSTDLGEREYYKVDSLGEDFYIPEGFVVEIKSSGIDNKNDTTVSNWYRGARYNFIQQSEYIPSLDQYLDIYQDKYDNIEYYVQKKTDYSSPILSQNLIANASFASTDGWIGTSRKSRIEKAKVEKVYGHFSGGKFIETQSQDQPTGDDDFYLKVFFPDADSVLINTGLTDNKEKTEGFPVGSQWQLNLEIYSEDGARVGFYCEGAEAIYEINGDYYKIFKDDENKVHFNFSNSAIKDPYTVSVDKFDYNTLEDFRTNSQTKLVFSQPVDGATYYIKKAQFFSKTGTLTNLDYDEYIKKENGEIVYEGQTTTTYAFYHKNAFDDRTITPNPVFSVTEIDRDRYKPIFNESAEKVKAVSVKESNYFNILQSIAETFECWLDFDIKRSVNGAILEKNVLFRNYIGKKNYAGVRYGINLKNITRTVESKNIVTKLYVKDNNNEIAKNGFCSITRAGGNVTRDNVIYDFRHYYDTGLLDANTVLTTLYEPLSSFDNIDYNTIISYYPKLAYLNKLIDENSVLIIQIDIELNKLGAQKQTFESNISASSSIIEEMRQKFLDTMDKPISAYSSTALKQLANSRKDVADIVEQINNQQIALQEATKQLASVDKVFSPLKEQRDMLQIKADQLVENKRILNQSFYSKYSRFIQEGTWIDEKYIDDEQYYNDSLSVMYNSCRPQISYTIDIVSLGALPGYEYYDYEIGDQTFVEDAEFFGHDADGSPKRIDAIITELNEELDKPENTKIKIQNFKGKFQDLFQKITASVQQTQYSSGAYEKAVALAEANIEKKASFLQDALSSASTVLSAAGQQSVTWDEGGLNIVDLNSPSKSIKMIGGAILISKQDKNGEKKWTTALTSDGISASLLTAGTINTSEISIKCGDDNLFRWDAFGLSAYDFIHTSDIVGQVNPNRFVRFDKHGFYGINVATKDGVAINGLEWNAADLEEVDKYATFSLTWSGLKVTGNGVVAHIGKQGDNIINITKGTSSIFKVTNSGNVEMTGTITATGGYIGGTNGWKIEAGKITTGTLGTDGFHMYSFGHGMGKYFGADSSQSWALGIGGIDSGFGVTSKGELYAQGAKISGDIKGGTISIGGDATSPNFKVDSSGNVTSKGNFTLSGNITLNGNITWGTGTSPTQVLYNANGNVNKPNGLYKDFVEGTNGWYKTIGNRKYASYTYDGGTTWTNAVKIVGDDGSPASAGMTEAEKTNFNNLVSSLGIDSTTTIDSKSIISPKIGGGYLAILKNINGKSTGVVIDPLGGYDNTNQPIFKVLSNNKQVMGFDKDGNAMFEGNITATSGTIGGWEIVNTTTEKSLKYIKTNSNKTIIGTGFQPQNSGIWAIAVGFTNDAQWSTAPFRVKHDGSMYAAKGQIAGWEISEVKNESDIITESKLTYGTFGSENGFHMYAVGHKTGEYFGATDSQNWKLGIGENFGVTTNGVLYAKKAVFGSYLNVFANGSALNINTEDNQFELSTGGTIPKITLKVTNTNHKAEISNARLVYSNQYALNTGPSVYRIEIGSADPKGHYTYSPVIHFHKQAEYESATPTSQLTLSFDEFGRLRSTSQRFRVRKSQIAEGDANDSYLESDVLPYLGTIKIINSFSSGKFYHLRLGADEIQFCGGAQAFPNTINTLCTFGAYYSSETNGEGNVVAGYVKITGLLKASKGAFIDDSDLKLKKDIHDPDASYEILFDHLRPRLYKWKEGTSGRTHSGYIVQETVEAIKNAGLTTQEFGAVVAFGPQEDEQTEWGMRYTQFISLNTWQIQKLKPRMTAAEKEIASLKLEVQQLREELAALKQ